MLTRKEQEILEVLCRAAEGKNVEIVTVQVLGGKKSPLIRVFIDTDHGVGFDELTAAQEWIDRAMDKLDPFPGAYTLEVSSPGIDRPLRTLEHFQRFCGETAVVKLTRSIEGRSSLTAPICAVEADAVVFDTAQGKITVPLDCIKSAALKGTIDFSSSRSNENRH